MKGNLLRIERMSSEDGPGIRSTVFFKGCPLRCVWCHNPESIPSASQTYWIDARCIGCGTCVKTCPRNCLSMKGTNILIDHQLCTSCLRCVKSCPSTALKNYGEEFELKHLVKELLKDQVYFEKSGGGVTLSGGEPTYQSEFARELLRELQKNGIHTAIDTCGFCNKEIFQSLLLYTDLLLFDLKIMDSAMHKKHIGQDNKLILENLITIRNFRKENNFPKEIWLRTPMVPGYTACEENINSIGNFIKVNAKDLVNRWELCAFNILCLKKYERLGLDWECKETKPLTENEMSRWKKVAQEAVGDKILVNINGIKR